jgi:predicted permease
VRRHDDRTATVLNRLRRWRRRDDDMRVEMETHIDLLADRYLRLGMPLDEARGAARRQFGSLARHREAIRLIGRRRWTDGLKQDFQVGIRQLRRSPGFSAVVVLTLALGIGGTTAVFSVTHAVLLAPLPYGEAGQLVRLYQEEPGKPGTRRGFSAPQFRMLREQAASFSGFGARYFREDLGLDLVGGGAPQRLRVLLVTADYFSTLAPQGFRGAGFRTDDERRSVRRDDRSGAARLVLSHAIWRARFNGDPAVIGRTVRLSAEPVEIAGIAPPGFEDPVAGIVDAWLPYDLEHDTLSENNSLVAFGRVRTGVSLTQAATELAVLSQAAKTRWPEASASSLVAVPLQEDVTGASRPLLQLLLLAVGLVLLVACANVANLMLVRATGRAREFAIRASLGSGRARLARQLVVESLVLAGLGGIAGLALAAGGASVLRTLGHDALPRLRDVGFDPIVLAFAAAVTIATALACAAAPAARLAVIDPAGVLTAQRSTTGTRRQHRLRHSLAAAQLALALALLASAGVLSVHFYRVMTVDPGFRVDGVLTFDVNLPEARYDGARRAAFQEELALRLAALPGVLAAGGTSRLPGTGSFHTWPVIIETGPLAGTSVERLDQPEHRTVSGDFFKALGIRVLAGRIFDERDDPTAPMRAVVSANFARLAFPGLPHDEVVGQRFAILGRRNTREIVGVVADVAVDVYGVQRSAVYTAHRQFAGNRNWMLTHAVATGGLPEAILPGVRDIVAAMDPEIVVNRPAAMADVVGRGASRERFALILMGTFAGVSLALAAIGLYGVLAYAVRQRTAEIGIRIALGATGNEVRSLVLRQAAGVVAAGLLLGTAGALGLGRWLSSLMFQVSPPDPRVLTAASVLLLVVCGIAAWLPARRAARVTPREAIDASESI